MNMNFQLTFEQQPQRPQVSIIKISGEIDEYVLDDFKKKLDEHLKKNEFETYIFHLSELKFINSIVISYFAEIYSGLNQKNRKMIFADGNEAIVDIFDLVGFFNLVEHYESIDKALESLDF